MTLDQPTWLVLLGLVPLVVLLAVLSSRKRRQKWAAFVADRLRPRLLSRSSPLLTWIALTITLIAFTLIVIALAQPQTSSDRKTQKILGRNIILMLDLSRSMNVRDVKPDRLTQAKATAYELLDALPNDRIGVIGFTATPYLFAPLTVDHLAVRDTISQLDTNSLPTGASNIAAGLELGTETLQATGTRQSAIVLLTDGEETSGSLLQAAEKASAADIEVITIGFGTEEGDFVPDESAPDKRYRDNQNREVISRLDPENLKKISQSTGGRFAIAQSGADIPAMVQAAVADLDRVELEGRETTVVTHYYQWFLLPAILFLIASIVASTRWRGFHSTTRAKFSATSVVLFTLFFLAHHLPAAIHDDALRALDDQRYEDAANLFEKLAEQHPDSETGYRYQLARATAAYHDGNWSTARLAFSDALRSRNPDIRAAAHHGLGNTLFEIGWARLSDGPRYPDTPASVKDDDNEGTLDALSNLFKRLSDALLGMPKPGESKKSTPLDDFELMAKQRLAEWLAETPDASGRSEGYERFDKLVTDWVDAIDHYDHARRLDRAAHNRQLTYQYLEKLREIFLELKQNAQQIQALPAPGEESQDGESGDPSEEPQEGDGSGEDQSSKKESGGNDPESSPSEGDPDKNSSEASDESDKKGPGQAPEPKKPEEFKPDPGETPEEAARRILKENADLQQGAIHPGGLRFESPEKDW